MQAIGKKGVTYVSLTYAESITPPTVTDYKETQRILKDFCIRIQAADIPRFSRTVDLIQWRTAYIRAALA